MKTKALACWMKFQTSYPNRRWWLLREQTKLHIYRASAIAPAAPGAWPARRSSLRLMAAQRHLLAQPPLRQAAPAQATRCLGIHLHGHGECQRPSRTMWRGRSGGRTGTLRARESDATLHPLPQADQEQRVGHTRRRRTSPLTDAATHRYSRGCHPGWLNSRNFPATTPWVPAGTAF